MSVLDRGRLEQQASMARQNNAPVWKHAGLSLSDLQTPARPAVYLTRISSGLLSSRAQNGTYESVPPIRSLGDASPRNLLYDVRPPSREQR
jgi:hypothetical protein